MSELIGKYWWLVVVGILMLVYFNVGSERYVVAHKTVYDEQTHRNRCVDKDTGAILDIVPPCWEFSEKGLDAIKKQSAKCVAAGGNAIACDKEAVQWMMDKLTQKAKKR